MNLILPPRLNANPQLYDYIHGLAFSEDGAIQMVHGAGQRVIFIARGRFSLAAINRSEAILHLTDLVEIDSFRKKNQRIRDLESCEIHVTVEAGVFVFGRHISPSHPEAQWPFHVYRTRYAFTVDPLAYARDKEIDTAYYHLVMTPALMESARYYYPVGSETNATAAEVRELGVTPAV